MCVFFRFRTHSSGVSKKDKLPVTGHPQKYDQMEIMSDIVAKEINVLKIDVPNPGGRGWKRTFSEISTQDQDLGENWGQQMSEGARYVLKETWVKANEPHYALRLAVSKRGFLCSVVFTFRAPPISEHQRGLWSIDRGRQVLPRVSSPRHRLGLL